MPRSTDRFKVDDLLRCLANLFIGPSEATATSPNRPAFPDIGGGQGTPRSMFKP